MVGLRDAITELEEKSAKALDTTLTATAVSAKAAINNFFGLGLHRKWVGGIVIVSWRTGYVKDLVKGVGAQTQHWRVRDVSVFCLLRMVSGAAHEEVHAAAFRKTIAKRKVRT